MKIQEIREIAKKSGINTKIGRSKQELIRDIQIHEGNAPCFRTKDSPKTDVTTIANGRKIVI